MHQKHSSRSTRFAHERGHLMRHLMLLASLVALSASLGAATLGDMSFENAMSAGHTRRAANLFDMAATTTPAAVDRFMNSALLEEGRESGAGGGSGNCRGHSKRGAAGRHRYDAGSGGGGSGRPQHG